MSDWRAQAARPHLQAFVLAAVVISSTVHAKQAADTSFIADSPDQAEDREANFKMAECLRKRAPDQVDEILAYNSPPAPRVAALLYSDSGSRCTRAAKRLSPSALVGAMFKSAYLAQDARSLKSSDLASQAGSYPDKKGTNDPFDYLSFADCIASRDLPAAEKLLAARSGRSDEREAAGALEEDATACAERLGDNVVEMTPFVAAMAQVLFRRSRGESFSPAGPAAAIRSDDPDVVCESDRPNVCVVSPANGTSD